MRLPDSAIELKSVIFNGTPLQYISDAEYFRKLKKMPATQTAVEEPPEAGFPLPEDNTVSPMVGELLPPELIADAELDRHAYPPWLTPAPGYYIDGICRPEYFTRIQNYLCFWPIAPVAVENELHIHLYRFDGR